MAMRNAVLFLAAITLAACIDITNANQVKDMPNEQLCEAYYFGMHPSNGTNTNWPSKQADIKKELENRQAVTSGNWAAIDQGRIEVGMSECALQAAWGHPLRITHAVTPAGNSSHYIYTLTRTADVLNGKISGFHY